MKCRFCKELTEDIFLDLGYAPPSNAYLNKNELNVPEVFFPLKLHVCQNCWLVQTEAYSKVDELFSKDYAYFSSTSSSWLEHAKNYVSKMISFLGLTKDSYVIEIASNDGYLLKNFVEKKIPCLGIEPTKNTADESERIGVPVLRDFFNVQTAKKIAKDNNLADLVCGNNVYAHVPDIYEFTQALKIILRPEGVVTLEFPHLLELIDKNQFDTVYHEHFSYLSFYTVCNLFSDADLKIFDVEKLLTHGGSLRVFGCHKNSKRKINKSVQDLISTEEIYGMKKYETYLAFQKKVNQVKNDFLTFLIEQFNLGKKVVAYGAAAKGNTLMNFAGIKTDLITCIYDAAKSKQGKYSPGSHLRILDPKSLHLDKPDYIIIFPWNISDEIIEQNRHAFSYGCKFVTFIPELKIISA